jgi:hypothetical protein
MPVVLSLRRVGDVLVAHEPKSDVAELEALRQDPEDAITQLTNGAAAQEPMTKPSPVHPMEIKRLRSALRDGNMKPIVRMSRTMKLVINDAEMTFVLPNPTSTASVARRQAIRRW